MKEVTKIMCVGYHSVPPQSMYPTLAPAQDGCARFRLGHMAGRCVTTNDFEQRALPGFVYVAVARARGVMEHDQM